MAQIGAQHARGAQDRGLARYENGADAQFPCNHGGVDGPGPAGADQREIPWIVAPFDRDLADRRGHVDIHHPVHAGRRGDGVEAERPGDMFGDRPARRAFVEPHPAAGEKSADR